MIIIMNLLQIINLIVINSTRVLCQVSDVLILPWLLSIHTHIHIHVFTHCICHVNVMGIYTNIFPNGSVGVFTAVKYGDKC